MKKLVLGFGVKIFAVAQTITSNLQTADCLLESFFVGLSNAHNLSYSPHLGSQFVLHSFEFFKSPPGKFDHHIVTVWNVLVQSAVFAAGNIF